MLRQADRKALESLVENLSVCLSDAAQYQENFNQRWKEKLSQKNEILPFPHFVLTLSSKTFACSFVHDLTTPSSFNKSSSDSGLICFSSSIEGSLASKGITFCHWEAVHLLMSLYTEKKREWIEGYGVVEFYVNWIWVTIIVTTNHSWINVEKSFHFFKPCSYPSIFN